MIKKFKKNNPLLKRKNIKILKDYLLIQPGYRGIQFFNKNIGKNMLIHRLIAQAFIPNPENKPQINHKNGIKIDNRIENLEWCTITENIRHAFKIKLNSGRKGESQWNAKLNAHQVLDIRNRLQTSSSKELAKEFNVSSSLINRIKRKIAWKHI